MKKCWILMAVMGILGACSQEPATITESDYLLSNTPENITITLGFKPAENRFYGKVVNNYFGRYTVDGDKITFQGIGSTMMMGPKEAMDAEQAYFKALQTVSSFRKEDNRLILETTDGEKLLFHKQATPLELSNP